MSCTITRNISFSVLDENKIKKIHDNSMYLMEKVGMIVTGERSVNLLKDKGATIDADGRMHISEKMVLDALAAVPKSLTLYNRAGEKAMVIDGNNQVYFGTHSDQLEYVDPFNNCVRPFLRSDTRSMCRVASYLKNIHFVLSVGMTADVERRLQTQSTLIETLKYFDKTINFSSNDVESLQDCIDILADFSGGLKNFQDKPFAFNYCEPIPPLTHPVESTEKLYISALNRVPVVYMPYCMMGGTSPMARAGSLAQCNAEALFGVVLTQLVSPGAPFIYGAMPSIFDMQTTIGSYGASEFHLNIAAMADLVNSYGLPFYGTAGCTDAKTVDVQAAGEASYEILSTLFSKANIVHDVGVMDHCKSVSPELVVLADEMIENYKSYSKGIDISDDDFAMDIIKEVGPGKHYMTHEHTLMNFRDVWYPNYYSRKMVNPDTSDVMPKIKDKLNYIINEWDAPALDKGSMDILSGWEKKLGL